MSAFDWTDLPEEYTGPPRTREALDAIAKLYRELPDGPASERAPWEKPRTLQEPLDPDPDYPWLDRSAVETLTTGTLFERGQRAARFQRAYGFHWRLGPNGENRAECEECGTAYNRLFAHVCMSGKKLEAAG